MKQSYNFSPGNFENKKKFKEDKKYHEIPIKDNESKLDLDPPEASVF